MLPRQPRSTLFPYTTLFRSNDQVWQADGNKTFIILSPESFRGRGVPRSYVWVLQWDPLTHSTIAQGRLLVGTTGNSRQRIGRILLRKLRDIGVRVTRLQQDTRIPAPDNLSHAGEIVLSFHCSHSISAVIVLIRYAIPETNHRSDDMRRGNI